MQARILWIVAAVAVGLGLAGCKPKVDCDNDNQCGDTATCVQSLGVCVQAFTGITISKPTENQAVNALTMEARLEVTKGGNPGDGKYPDTLNYAITKKGESMPAAKGTLTKTGSGKNTVYTKADTWTPNPLVNSDWVLLVSSASIKPDLPAATRNFKIDVTPPNFTVAVTTESKCPASSSDPLDICDSGWSSHSNSLYHRDETIDVTITSDKDIGTATVTIGVQQFTATVDTADKKKAVAKGKLFNVPMGSFRQIFTVSASGTDSAGNHANIINSVTIDVTRWKWRFNSRPSDLTDTSITAAPVIDSNGNVYFVTNSGSPSKTAIYQLDPSGASQTYTSDTKKPSSPGPATNDTYTSLTVGKCNGVDAVFVAGYTTTGSDTTATIWKLNNSARTATKIWPADDEKISNSTINASIGYISGPSGNACTLVAAVDAEVAAKADSPCWRWTLAAFLCSINRSNRIHLSTRDNI